VTFLIDDLLVRPLVGFIGILHEMAIKEMHDVEAIRDDLKENRLLYEIGERPEDEYERRKEKLEAQLEEAREVREHLRGRAEVLG